MAVTVSTLGAGDVLPLGTRVLPGSGLRVPEFILGSATFSDCDAEEIHEVVEAYLHGGGFALEIVSGIGAEGMRTLGRIVREHEAANIVTFLKSGGSPRCTGGVDSSRRSLAKGLDACLDLLEREHVDVWMLEALDDVTRTSEVARTLEWAVESGRTDAVAICGVPAWRAVDLDHELQSRGLRLAAHAIPHSLLERRDFSSSIPAARSREYAVLGASPLAGGVLTGKYRHGTPAKSRRASKRDLPARYFNHQSRAVIESLSTAAQGLGVHPGELAMAWCLARPNINAHIVGARSAAQVKVALRAANLNVPQEITDALDEVSSRLLHD